MLNYINFDKVTRIRVTFPTCYEGAEYYDPRYVFIPRKFFGWKLKSKRILIDKGWYKENYFYCKPTWYGMYDNDVPTFHENPYGFYEKIDTVGTFVENYTLYNIGEIVFYLTDGKHIAYPINEVESSLYDELKAKLEKYHTIELF